jgi:DNA replication protein DnaC
MESQTPRKYPERDADCEIHGAYTSRNYFGSIWSGCETCSQEREEANRKEAQRKVLQERAEAHMRLSGLEGRFMDVTFDEFEATTAAQGKVLTACREYAQTVDFSGGVGLWLIGPPGTGKTHLGSAMVRHVIQERDRQAMIYSGREIIRMLRATWGVKERGRTWDGRAMSEEGVIDDLGRAALLVIDEIGVGFGTDSEHVQLFDVIDLRYKYRRPTVLLSNLPAKGLKDAMGDRAYDRLREGAQVLACNWDSHRGKPAAPRQGLEVVR